MGRELQVQEELVRVNQPMNGGGDMDTRAAKKSWKLLGCVLVLVAMICGSYGAARAAVASGISGLVTDSSGAVIVGATIEVKSAETGITETQQTNADGFYAFLDLPPGHYHIEAR